MIPSYLILFMASDKDLYSQMEGEKGTNMKVQELFRRIDRQRLYELYCTVDEKFANEPEPRIGPKIICETIDEILSITPVTNDDSEVDFLMFEPYEEEDMDPEAKLLGDVYGQPKEEFKKDLYLYEILKEIHGEDIDAPDCRYAMDFTPWSEMLGLNVPDEIIEKYGEDVMALNIFWEMTFNGWDEASHDNRCDEILSKYPDREE